MAGWRQASETVSLGKHRKKAPSVKENVLKRASLVDQTGQGELLPASTDKVQEWTQRYITLMGSPPEEEEEEATDIQLAALCEGQLLLAIHHTDFSVWTQFGRRSLRSQRFRTAVLLGDGSCVVKEFPGPQNLTQWLACWRVQSCSFGFRNSQSLGLAAVREGHRKAHLAMALGLGPNCPGRRQS